MKAIVSMILLAAALSVPLRAQTLTEQLQKGIYTEETLGNGDEAARIYRQIIAAPAVPRSIAQEAERRLDRLRRASKQPRAAGMAMPPQSDQRTVLLQREQRGAVEQGRYRHFSSGVTFDLPPQWTASDTYPSSDGGDMVTLSDEGTKRTINVWLIKEETPPAQVAARMAGAPTEKVRQRHSGYGIPGMRDERTYEIPSETVQPILINGQPGIVAVGNYLGTPPEGYGSAPELTIDTRVVQSPRAPQPMNEYMTWVYTQQSRVFFFARVPADDLPQFRPIFEQLVYSAVIP